MSINTSCVCADNADSLIVAGGNAAAAEDALVVIANHVRCRGVKLINGLEAVERALVIDSVFKAELLKLAFLIADAGKAFSVVS